MQQLCASDSFVPQKLLIKKTSADILMKVKSSELTRAMSTPQIYLSRQPTGNKLLWHIPTSWKVSGQRKKIFSFSFCSVIKIFFQVIEVSTKAEKAIPCETQVFRAETRNRFHLMNVKKWRFKRIISSWNRKDLSLFFFAKLFGEESKFNLFPICHALKSFVEMFSFIFNQ